MATARINPIHLMIYMIVIGGLHVLLPEHAGRVAFEPIIWRSGSEPRPGWTGLPQSSRR